MIKIQKVLASRSNFKKAFRQSDDIKYIVIHYTGNNGDTAQGNCQYFRGGNRGASAHYFIDEKEVCQSVEDVDIAWHCGSSTNTYKHKHCRNSNSIGVEICSRKDRKGNYYFKDEVIKNTVDLVKILMKKYNISEDNVVRHYDITGKICPKPFVKNGVAWVNFKNKLSEVDYMKVKRTYQFGSNKKEFEVINDNGENYIKIRDLVNLIGKDVSYDNKTKVTKIE